METWVPALTFWGWLWAPFLGTQLLHLGIWGPCAHACPSLEQRLSLKQVRLHRAAQPDARDPHPLNSCSAVGPSPVGTHPAQQLRCLCGTVLSGLCRVDNPFLQLAALCTMYGHRAHTVCPELAPGPPGAGVSPALCPQCVAQCHLFALPPGVSLLLPNGNKDR